MAKAYNKSEKLKHRSAIRLLFAKGKSLKCFPVKLVYFPLTNAKSHKVGMSVPKRRFKRAVDRNYLKRVLREGYRHHKHLAEETPQKYAIMLIYIGKEQQSFKAIDSSVCQLLNKLKMLTP